MPTPESKALDRILEGYAQVLKDVSVPLGVRVGLASDLWAARESLEAALEPFKTELRTLARTQLKGVPGVATFEGEDFSKAVVVVQGPVVGLSNTFDPEQAKKILGADFGRVFKVTTNPRPDALKTIPELPESARRYLAEALTLGDATPRVSLRNLKGVEHIKT